MHFVSKTVCLLGLFCLVGGAVTPGTLIFESKKSHFERHIRPVHVTSVDDKTGKKAAGVKTTVPSNAALKGMTFSDSKLDYSKKKTIRVIKTSIGAVFFVAGCLLGVGIARSR